MICFRDFVGNLSPTLSQSRRNGIWVLPNTDFSVVYTTCLLAFKILSRLEGVAVFTFMFLVVLMIRCFAVIKITSLIGIAVDTREF